jgi:hypothetical protein
MMKTEGQSLLFCLANLVQNILPGLKHRLRVALASESHTIPLQKRMFENSFWCDGEWRVAGVYLMLRS